MDVGEVFMHLPCGGGDKRAAYEAQRQKRRDCADDGKDMGTVAVFLILGMTNHGNACHQGKQTHNRAEEQEHGRKTHKTRHRGCEADTVAEA